MPNFAAALLKQRGVAESDPGLPFGFLVAHAFAHQLLGSLFNVNAHFVCEVVVNLAATEDLWNPFHWRPL